MPTKAETSHYSELRILVAEDNDVNRMVIEGLLNQYDMEPEFAKDGQEAVEKFSSQNEPYDLILMDCEMPVMDGFAATEKIRQLEQAHQRVRTPIIALTAHAESSYRERVDACGMDHFLGKPITIIKLYEALQAVGVITKTA